MKDSVSEDEALRQVMARLTTRFPEFSQEQLSDVAVRSLHTFDDAHVRDFVPVLAERAAVELLRRSQSAETAVRGKPVTHAHVHNPPSTADEATPAEVGR